MASDGGSWLQVVHKWLGVWIRIGYLASGAKILVKGSCGGVKVGFLFLIDVWVVRVLNSSG